MGIGVRSLRVCWVWCGRVYGEVGGKKRVGAWRLCVWARICAVCVVDLLGVVVVEGFGGSETRSSLVGLWMCSLGRVSMLFSGGLGGMVAMSGSVDAVLRACLICVNLETPPGC